MNKTLEQILEKYKEEMIEKLQELIRIESVTTPQGYEGTKEAPYGEGAAKALKYMEELAKEKGFKCTDYDNQVCELDFGETMDDAVGIIGHLDVVPVGGTWKYPPFGGELHDGKIYGRGAVDDKGPTIAAFYAALAIKESGLPLKRNVTQIMGTNEEGGAFPCLQHYLAKAERIPSCGIVPDSFYPICFAEKHFINLKFTAVSEQKECSPEAKSCCRCGSDGKSGRRILKELEGGEAINAVPAWAKAVIVDENGNVIEELTETGTTAHASTPDQGKNAIAALLNRLAQQDFEPADICTGIKELSQLMCNDLDGTGLGIFAEDETGVTTNNLGLISYKDGVLTAEANARLPLSLDRDKTVSRLNDVMSGKTVKYEVTHFIDGFYEDPETEPSKTLIQVYREETGDMDSKPYANGSGSYARIMKHFLPFGIARQDEALMFHVEDECITTERLFETARIYAEALYRLAK